MNPGDLIHAQCANGITMWLFTSDSIPWNGTFGMTGPRIEIHSGITGIILGREEIRTGVGSPNVFYKLVTSCGNIGWIHESFLVKSNETG